MSRSIFHSSRAMVRQRGTTMLEVLISIVVIAFGLLGLAGLQAVSLKNNNTAYYRSQATMFAYDIAERMRANSAVAKANGYDIAVGATAVTGGAQAQADMTEWKTSLGRAFPSGDAKVLVNNQNVEIDIQWNEGSSTTIFTTQTRL